MLRSYTAIGMLMFVTSVACNKKPVDEPKPEGQIESLEYGGDKAEAGGLKATLAAIIPRLGGNLVALGDHGLELAIHESGLVEGLLFDAQGKPVEKPEGAELAVKLQAKGGAEPIAKLKWNADSKRFVGNATLAPEAKSDAGAEAKAEAETSDAEGKGAKSADAKSADAKTADAKTADSKSADAKVAVKGKAAPAADANAEADADAKADTKVDTSAKVDAAAETAALADLELEAKPVSVDAKLDGKAQSATLTEYALLPAPEFGGTVLSAGQYKTELIGRPDGHLQAFVSDASGAKLDAAAKAKLKAQVGAKAADAVELKWDPGHACFVGKLEKGAKFHGEPVRVTLDADGKAHVGGVAKLPITVEVEKDAAVVVAGEFPVELTSKAGFVEARVFDASGKAHATGDLNLNLLAGAQAKADAGAKAKANASANAMANPGLALKWHVPCACYRAKLGAKLDLFAAPIKVKLRSNGLWHTGAAASLKMAQNARLHADGKLAAAGKLGGDAKLDAKLPSAKAKLNADAKSKLDADAKAKLDAAAKAKAKAKANAAVAAKGNSNVTAKANVAVPKPKVEVKKSASASTDNKGSAKAGVKAGFSLGTK